MNLPKISIIIPVYNGSNYLANAIECALQQTYENVEVIVINDGSTDDGASEKVALSYSDRIRYFRKVNGGVSSALNYGIAKMTGDYFSWLSHDDAYSPDKIKSSVDLLIAHDSINKKAVAFTSGYFIDKSGAKIKDFSTYFKKQKKYSGSDVVSIMTQKGTLNGCCMLIPRSAFDIVGGFDETLRYSQDTLMWYRIFLSGYSLISDGMPNVMNRIHENQVSHLRRDLFAHDALVIATLLAEPLAQADGTGALLNRYIKRLTRYECTEAIDYLYQYAVANGYMNAKERIKFKTYRIAGFCRRKVVTVAKKTLLRFRH